MDRTADFIGAGYRACINVTLDVATTTVSGQNALIDEDGGLEGPGEFFTKQVTRALLCALCAPHPG